LTNTRNFIIYLELIEAFGLTLKVEGLRPHTISCYLRDAKRFVESVGETSPSDLKTDHVRRFLQAFGKTVSPRTVASAQLGLRRFFRFLVDEGEIKRDPSATIRLKRYRTKPQPTYSPSEISVLIAACDTTTDAGIRDRAMLTVLFDTGVRVGELVFMRMPNWDTNVVSVDGKTGVRIIPLGVTSQVAIRRYVRRWGIHQGLLWRGRRGVIKESGVFQMIRRVAARAGVEFKGVHAFRRATAAQMKRLGMNDSDILEIMGWKDVTMLRRYTAAVSFELAQAAHSRFSPMDLM